MKLFVGQAGDLNAQRASQVAGVATAAIGAAALVGWWVSLPSTPSWGFATIKPTTALCLIAVGLAVLYPGKDSRLAFAVGLAVAVIAVLDLLDRFGIDSGIDSLNRMLVPQPAARAPETSLRSMNGVPVSLALAGCSLALTRFARHHFVAVALASLAGVIQVFALLAYLEDTHRFYDSIEAPTLLTAFALVCAVTAIVLRTGAVPAHRKPRPLWHLLIMLGCAIIAPLLLFGLYAGIRITDTQRREARNELLTAAHTLSANVDREITGEIKTLQALAASSSLRRGDFAEFQRQAEASVASRPNDDIMLVDRDMRQLVNTRVPFGAPLEKVAVPGFVERALATGKPQISGLFWASASQKLTFGIIVPVRIDGESRYALVASPDQRALADLIATSELPAGWQAAVSDLAHRIISGSDRQDAFPGKELSPTQWPRAGRAGVSEFTDSAGRPSLEAYARSELTGWETDVWAATALLDAPIRALWWTIGLTALTAFALVIILASWLGRLVARSVGLAARAAVNLGTGGPLPSDETPVAEVDTLMAELRAASARRQAAQRDLQASKDRMQLAFEATQLGWWQYDPRRGLVSWDGRCQEIVDIERGDAPFEEFLERVHPDDRGMFMATRKAALNPADPKPYANEYRILRRDGKVRWLDSRGLAYFEGAGPKRHLVSFVGAVQDITERKEREEKEHLLMREINHRAKNMLSVVDAIAHQTATRNPEDFIERFSARIQALSANQDLLVRNEWSGVEIAELVQAQLAHFVDLIGSRITLRGPRLRLKAASAQAVGLALHELATNAGKYGALSTDMGRVDICWETDNNTFTMSWTERGGPQVSAPERRGFGTVVIEAMTARSVGGEVQLDYAPSGVVWRLTSPAANAIEADGGYAGS